MTNQLNLHIDNLPSAADCKAKVIWGTDDCLAGASVESKAFVEQVNKPRCFRKIDEDFLAGRIDVTTYRAGYDLIASVWHNLRSLNSSWTD